MISSAKCQGSALRKEVESADHYVDGDQSVVPAQATEAHGDSTDREQGAPATKID